MVAKRVALGLLAGAWATLAVAAGAFDGTYRGSQVTIRTNNSATCAKMDRDDVVIRIVDNKFSRSWGVSRGGDRIDLEVAPDGTFKGFAAAHSDASTRRGARAFEMSGRIVNGVLEAEIGSNLCAVKMTLRKS